MTSLLIAGLRYDLVATHDYSRLTLRRAGVLYTAELVGDRISEPVLL